MLRTRSLRIVGLYIGLAALSLAGCVEEDPTAPAKAGNASNADVIPVGDCLTIADAVVGDFQVCRLATLGGADGQPVDVNDDEWIVGRSQRADGANVAALWTGELGDEPTDLGLAAGMLRAEAISANGWVAGSTLRDGGLEVIRWREDTGAETLTRPAEMSTLSPTGVNYDGYVSATGRSGTTFQATRYTTFWGPRVSSAGADDINDAGIMVGWSVIGGVTKAVMWADDLWRVDLGTLPGDRQSWAMGINNAFPAHIVGRSQDVYSNQRAFIRDPVARVLLELPGLGGNWSEATDVNDAGYAVGNSELADGSTVHAVLWTPDREVVELVGLGGAGEHSYAYGINNYGSVVGWSWVSGTAYPTLWRVPTTPPPPPSPDSDGDGIDDVVDTEPDVQSDDFSDGTTTGTIVDRAGQTVLVKDVAGAGVRIAVQASALTTSAQVSVCDGAGLLNLQREHQVVVTCSSVTVRVEWGGVAMTFVDRGGITTWAFVERPDGVTFNPRDGSLEAAADNLGIVFATRDFEQYYQLEAGERLEGTGVYNAVPIAVAGPDQTVECERNGEVRLDGSASSDPDGDPLTYTWSESGTVIATGATATVVLAPGVHTITLTVDDGQGGTATDEVVITVKDTKAPVVHLSVHPAELWPPNHKMVLVANDVSASDACCTPDLAITVTSDEPVNGTGDGDSEPDWQVVNNGDGTFDVWVRGERSGRGGGRVYTIEVRAVDRAGNASVGAGTVTVPKSRGKKKTGT